MSDTLRTIVQDLATLDPVTAVLVELFGWMISVAAGAIVLICVASALAQCCGRARPRLTTSTLLFLPLLTGGLSAATAQETGARTTTSQEATIPDLEPRLERLWGRDSIRLSVNMCGVQCSNQISLSPDGRWILMQSYDPTEGNKLWLAPTGGGEMIGLARGTAGGEPQWFPSGDAVAFTSSKLGEAATLMRLPIPLDDGRPRGPARQVALEPVEQFAVSPDGSAIAYLADFDPDAASGSVLRVIPATGGNPTSESPIRGIGFVMTLRWAEEGNNLYLLTWRNIHSDELALYRMPAEGGEPELVSVWYDWVHLGPRARYLVRGLPSGEGEESLYEAATLTGRPLARFRLPRTFELAGFTGNAGELLVVRQDIVNPLRILPVAGGPIRRLNDAWGYDLPLAWTGNGEEVFFRTTLNGDRAFMLAPVDGGPMREVPLPRDAERPRISSDGSQVLYLIPDTPSAPGREPDNLGGDLFIYDVEGGTTVPIVTPPEPFEIRLFATVGSRGMARTSEGPQAEFGYALTRLGRHEVYLVDRSGASSLGWSIPEEDWTPGDNAFGNIAIHGNLLAFAENADGEGTLFLAEAGEDRARPILTLPGSLGPRGSNAVRWSPDGRLLTVSYRAPEEEMAGLLLVEISDSGELVGEPHTLPMDSGPDWLFGIQWMPDGRHFVAVGGMLGSDGQDVWLFSLDPGTPPVNLTTDLQEPVWYFHLSPDGRYVAFESEMPRGSSIWRVDLGDILAGAGG